MILIAVHSLVAIMCVHVCVEWDMSGGSFMTTSLVCWGVCARVGGEAGQVTQSRKQRGAVEGMFAHVTKGVVFVLFCFVFFQWVFALERRREFLGMASPDFLLHLRSFVNLPREDCNDDHD